MRKVASIPFLMVLFSGLSLAQIPTSGNVFFGYSYQNTDLSAPSPTSTNGWEATLEGKVLPFIGIAADFSSYYGSENITVLPPCPIAGPLCGPIVTSVGTTESNYLFGPRASISISRFRPFAEVLIGAGHINVHATASDTSFATAIGGGLDYKLLKVLAWRFQGDYLRTSFFSTSQNNVRLTTGLVVRF